MENLKETSVKSGLETENDNSFTYLVSFSNGRLKCENNDNESINFTEYKQSSMAQKNPRRILVAKTSRLQYKGTNFGHWVSQTSSVCNYQLVVLNKRTNEVKLYNTNFADMKPIMENIATNNDETKTFSQKQDLLNTTFGSKKKRLAIQSKIKYSTNDSANSSALSEAVDKSVISDAKKTPGAANTQTDEILPQRNRDASVPSAVYDLSQIISQDVYDGLTKEAGELKCASATQIAEWKTNQKYCNFVIHHLERFRNAISDKNAKILCYYNYVTALLKISFQDWRKKDPLPNVPESALKQDLFKRFSVTVTSVRGQQNRSMPAKMKDKVMAHALVLALFVDNFSVQVPSFQQDFRAPIQKISKMANAIGCHVSNKRYDGVPISVIELKIPLFVPNDKPFLRGKRKK